MSSLSIEDYHVGIVCALHSELAAVEAMLDEEHESIKTQDTHDHNAYSVGRIHQHNVAIACLPAGVDGLAAAATVAKDMSRTFRQLRFGLLVGIGGGIPDPERVIDIRLGDVVVSEPSGTEGGVVQYDKGKNQANGVWERKGTLNAPPTVLLTALQKLKARHMRYDSQIPSLMTDMLQKYPKMARMGYSYPGQDQIPQPPRETNNPEIHYGIIASGDGVIKDATVRDRIRGECGALCVEMEAAGLMNNFPCLVIRGICDYADADKNDRWHRYAAATAAAYAKELLSCVSTEQISQEAPIQVVLGTLSEHFDQVHAYHSKHEAHLKRQETHYHSDKHRDCHRAFKTSNYEEHKNINPDRAPNTCQWLSKHSKYLQWQESGHNDLLWISADPGCGKSVLSKSLIDRDLRSNENEPHTTICYFFFKDNEVQDSLAAALCAVLHQLFDSQPQLIRHALPAWEKSGSRIAFEVYELWRILQKATTDHEARPVLCVLDALDECRDIDRRCLISLLCNFYSIMATVSQAGQLKFIVTSRPYEDIEHSFGRIATSLPSIRLRGEDENDQIGAEIDLVVRQRVQEIVTDFQLATQTAEKLERKLMSMTHRTYLWLYLAIDNIRQTFSGSLRPDQESIDLLPASVDEAYEQILSKVEKSQAKDVRMILTIIVGVPRPLSLGEMALALDVATSKTVPQSFADLSITEEQLLLRIRHWCGLFVFINHSQLYLIHQTAKEFLLNKPGFERSDGDGWKHCLSVTDVEREMARVYMLYLCLQEFELEGLIDVDSAYILVSGGLVSGRVSQDQNHKLTLFGWAAQSWPDLWENVELSADEELQDKAWMLYDMGSRRFSRWTKQLWQAEQPNHNYRTIRDIVLAAYNNHLGIMRRILDTRPQDIDLRDGGGCTALIQAVMRHHHDVIAFLLMRGADVNVQSKSYGSALHAALDRGYGDIVQMLINAGADVNAHEGLHGGALCTASQRGHGDIVRMLIKAGANVNVKEDDSGSALCIASHRGHSDIVQMLVRAGADVNADEGLYGSALCIASKRGHGDIVRMLIEAGADVNAQGGFYDNALCAASSKGHDDIVQTLVAAGADVDAQGQLYGSALYEASESGYGGIIQTLIDAGAEVNVRRGHHRNPLFVASERGHANVVRVLLEAGADVNACGGYYGDALHAAPKSGHEDMVRMLRRAGANVNAQGGCEGSALIAASQSGHIIVVRILLKAGADVNAQGGRYGNALNAASMYGYNDIVQALVDAGAHAENHRPRSDGISFFELTHDPVFVTRRKDLNKKRKIAQALDSIPEEMEGVGNGNKRPAHKRDR